MASKFPAEFHEAKADFDDVDAMLGEVAAYLSDTADRLSEDPESLSLSPEEWPAFSSLLTLKAAWIDKRNSLIAAWRKLDTTSRASHSLPPFGAANPARPLV